jgi:hypothetical protein
MASSSPLYTPFVPPKNLSKRKKKKKRKTVITLSK